MSHPLTIPDGATAHRLQQRKRAVLRWCWAHGYVEQNVAGEGIEGALPAMPAVKAHFRALPYQEVAAPTPWKAIVEGRGFEFRPAPHREVNHRYRR